MAFPRGNRGRGRGGRPGKKRDMGRTEWSKEKGDKRKRNDDEQAAKRQRVDKGEDELPIYATKFTEDELNAEERRPKKKVAVLIGYAGTGYKGMQLTHDQKTIEGDLFQAFVAAGAISKANADDPKKSSFVRCARTDKGVHAAGNLISLKLIVEDEDIVKKINENLVPQIRVWGLERTNNSFSAYQLVDSRIYEYLIPSHSFLPPHPRSFLGKQCEEWAKKKNETEAYRKRQEEVQGFWEKVDEEMIGPILKEYDEPTRNILEKALYLYGNEDGPADAEADKVDDNGQKDVEVGVDEPKKASEAEFTTGPEELPKEEPDNGTIDGAQLDIGQEESKLDQHEPNDDVDKSSRSPLITDATKRLRQAYITAKRTYRIPKARMDRIQEALNYFTGTRNYHNFTIEKSFRDPSARRVIKSFILNTTPILINGTEWLSLKVHGQSFMMHQIRKMVGMVALVVRCGCDPKRMHESLGPDNISIPKAPALGLLLERPVFDNYNRRAKSELSREPIDFDKFKAEIDDFKQREIYERMYRDEEKENVYGNFFNHVDNFPSEVFLYVTSGGIEATKGDNKIEGNKGWRKAANAHQKEALVDVADVNGNVEGDSDDEDVTRDDKYGDEG